MQSILLNATSMPNQCDHLLTAGFLNVGDGHRLYVAQYGQIDAPAVVVLHGGPGSGCNPSMLEWFDLRRWRVILVDQRGAGKSTSDDPLSCNTTADLVRDLERLRETLCIDRWTVVGGSWGACLALLYAGYAPEAVSNLVLRGVFLAADADVHWFFQGLRQLVPEQWAQLTADWFDSEQRAVFQTLAALLQNGTVVQQQEAARRWGQYEEAVMRAMGAMFAARTACPAPSLETWLPKYRLQAHYLSMRCFTSTTSLANAAARASNIPTTIIHGTHDWICRPQNAAQVKRWMPQARLDWIARGTHTASDPLIRNALRTAIARCVSMPISSELFVHG